jgi:hypothetical protein
MRERPFALMLSGAILLFASAVYVLTGSVEVRAVGPAGRPPLVAASPGAGQASARAPESELAAQAAAQRALLNRYCVPCHNERLKTADLTLDTLDIAKVGDNPVVWEKVVQKLHGRLMPPGGRPRPDETGYQGLITYLERSLDRAADANPNPGRTEALHRLNRAEYRNAVRDLLALDIDVGAMLPADDVSYGFDNIAGVQRMSPTLMERYLAAARKISSVAVGATEIGPVTETYNVPPELRQDHRLDGLPFGTRGGALLRHTFPRDGEYAIRVQLTRFAGAIDEIPTFDQTQRLELSIDGAPVHVFELTPEAPQGGSGTAPKNNRRALDADWIVKFAAKAGPRDVMLTFLNRTPALLENLLEPFEKPVPGGPNGYYPTQKGGYLRNVEIIGPFTITRPGDTPSRRRIFVCQPRAAADEAACARRVISTLARRAFRRPVGDADVQTLLAFYEEGREEGTFETGIERAVEGLLVSPEFLFRVQRDPATATAGTPYRISSLDLASRLSFFLWSSIPDDRLLDVAVSGRLQQPAVLEQEVRRMLADPRADALVTNFVGQWLFLRNLPTVLPDPKKDPDFDEGLRSGFRRETEMLASSIFREDRSVLELLTADYTFVNERLAKHYGIPGVRGDHFRRVKITDDNRRGLLGQGSMLAVTSMPHRTSPVVRGKWILENLLGTPLPPPPPDVPALEETQTKTDEVLTMRETIARHRANPVCASCHAMMDPLGLALENFDFVGRWRDVDEAVAPIDASAALPDGTKFDGPAGLRQMLLDRPERFVTTLVEKMLVYALGRGLEHYDMPAVRKITREAARNNYKTASLVLGVVNSLPFQMRRPQS